MHIISMQSKEVWNILRNNGVYHADVSKCREHASYKEDIVNLGGYVPIWGFAYPDMSSLHMRNGQVLERLRCEMSLQQENCWDDFLLFELDIPDMLVLTGKHHNDCTYSKVFPAIYLNQVRAVYSIHDSDKDGWYFKVLTPIYLTDKEVITRMEMDCAYWDSIESQYVDCFDNGEIGHCLKCGRETPYLYKGKHYCSLGCMHDHKERLISNCVIHGDNPWELMSRWDILTDTDFD